MVKELRMDKKHIFTNYLMLSLLSNIAAQEVSELHLIYREYDDTYGYKNNLGDTIIPYGKYMCHIPYRTLGFISKPKEKDIVAISPSGTELFKVFQYDNGPDHLSEGVFRMIGNNNKMGFADTTGHIVIPPRFDFVTPFKNGHAFFNTGGRNVPINKSGEYHMITGGHWGVINKEGKEICPALLDSVPLKYKGIQTEIIYQKQRMPLEKAMIIIQKRLEKKKNRLIKQEKYNDKTIVWEELSTKNGACTYVAEWEALEKDIKGGNLSVEKYKEEKYLQDSLVITKIRQIKQNISQYITDDNIIRLRNEAQNKHTIFYISVKIDSIGMVTSVRIVSSKNILVLLSAKDVYAISLFLKQSIFKRPREYDLDSIYFSFAITEI